MSSENTTYSRSDTRYDDAAAVIELARTAYLTLPLMAWPSEKIGR